MEKIEHIYELIENSNISLLGYHYNNERIKDEIISKLPSYVVYDYYNPTQIIRDIKLNQVLDNLPSVRYVVLDTCNIVPPNTDYSRNDFIRNLINEIQDKFSDKYKLIITSPLYKNPLTKSELTFTGGSSLLHMSSLTFVIKNKLIDKNPYISIIKNRHGDNMDISIDGLKNMITFV